MSVPYIDGSGALRQRKSASGDGTTGDPDVFSFADQGTYDRLGAISDSPISTPTTSGSLASVIRGLWQNMLGTASDASSPTGSIHAKLRSLIADTVGATSDALSTTGSLMARVRTLSEGLGTVSDAASSTGSIHAKLRSLGASQDAAASSGSLMAMLRFLAESKFLESQTASAVTVSTSLTTVITFDCRGKRTLGVQLQNTGGLIALSALQVQARFNSSLSIWNTIASTNADFTTNNGKTANNTSAEIINSAVSGGTIPTLPANGTAYFRMHCEGMESVRIQAQVAMSSTTVLAHGIME
ncbi:MAG: hypothetical protein HWQ36_25990 [Nostoc sp. NMS2]|uniref:hypothetical protein n=1 Tax=Nostoc sp. NMS2 TaxID=2815389 RepID=UPI0025FA6FF6|nr:hypothetical protein [Nostoc sp. NMS2]MBN3993838.1 hypothetical protein [Nostoc sp. NMS2]